MMQASAYGRLGQDPREITTFVVVRILRPHGQFFYYDRQRTSIPN